MTKDKLPLIPNEESEDARFIAGAIIGVAVILIVFILKLS